MPRLERSEFSLHGKVIVQCGGSGLLGRALVAGLANSGATLVVASRDPAAFRSDLNAARAAGGFACGESYDPASETSIRALCDRVLAAHGRVDGLVFNVVSRPMTGMADDLALWQESMAVNATGFFAVVRAFGDAMSRGIGGSIVNISSIQGMVGMNPWLYEGMDSTVPPDYFFNKGGMINLSRYLASHYGSKRVRVNTVSPGGIFNAANPPGEEFLRRYGSMTMLGRMAEAAEISGAVVFLLSDASTYVTGANLAVDGGYTAK